MRFEWDDQKARENLKQHGVTFGEATEVFYDPYALEAYDIEHSTIEARFFIIGCRAADCFTWFMRNELEMLSE